jgi:MATE family multidrug resistance protein
MFVGMKDFFRKYRKHYRENLKLAIPVAISQLGHTLVHTADSVIVGHFAGTTALAAVSLVNSIFMIILVLGIGIASGLTPLIAQENGRRNYDECGKLFANSLLINFIAGIVLFTGIYFCTLLIIDHLNQSPEVVRLAKPYLFLLGISIIPLMVFNTFKQFAEGLGLTKQAMMVSIWGNVLNICLGIIFVKGLFGITPMGVIGVGWSTFIDRFLMASVMAIYVFRSKYFKIYLKSFLFKNISSNYSRRIFNIGIPVAMQYTFEISAFSGAAILIGSIGAVEQAAHQIAINLASITYMVSTGIAAAATIKSGNNYGARNYTGLRTSAISSYHIVLVFMIITATGFILGHSTLPWLYTSDQNVISIAAQLLIIAGLFQLFDGTQVVGLGVLRGMGDVKIPTYATFLAYWVIGIPVAYLLGVYYNLGVNGVWYGLTLGLLIASILLFLRFQHISKKLAKSVS